MEIVNKEGRSKLTQQKHIEHILEKYSMKYAKEVDTPSEIIM